MVAGHLREGLNRLALVLLLAAFCLPLFFGLGRTDLENDEAIYSYAVESILTTGEWASPRSSPLEHVVFLEKPPLKFWIVAAPIRLGLLPLNEFGLRFWDAVLGSAAFAYVLLFGWRLAGPVCGVCALLVVFGNEPLIFHHGLRSNNMEASLVLAYCGGLYHFGEWATGRGDRRWHIAACAALFYLGFMTKFVAVVFLPLVAGLVVLLQADVRQRFAADWRRWGLAGIGVLAAALPWFVYQYFRHGQLLLEVMFGQHVYARFTEYTDPTHVRVWHFYFSEGWLQLSHAHAAIWVVFGAALLLVHSLRRPTPERLIVLLWFLAPVTLISFGTSKLYHYFYPYVPPLALAGGYGAAWLAGLIIRPLRGRLPRPAPVPRWRRLLFGSLAVLALGVALFTYIEPIRLQAGGRTVFSNHSVARPLIAGGVFALAGGWWTAAATGALLLAASLVIPSPVDGYRKTLQQLGARQQPLRALGECLREVDVARRARGERVFEPYAPVYDRFVHPYFYYLRGDGWLEEPDEERVRTALFDPDQQRPVAMDSTDYVAFLARPDLPDALPRGISRPGIVILLPGDYAECRFTSSLGVQ